MKKIVLLIITLLVLSGCGFRSKELNEETKQKIQQEISKINDKMSQDELENMMSVAKLNYDVNPEIGKMYFEKLVKYKPEASIYLSDYYYEKKDEVNYEKWTKYGAERDVLDMIYNLAVFYNEKNRLSEAEYWYQKAANKGDGDAEYNLAIVYGKEEKYSEAEKIWHKQGRDGSGRYNMAIYYETHNQPYKAEQLYKEMIKMGDVDGYYGLGNMYRKLKKIDEAEKILKIGVEKKEFKAIYSLANLYLDKLDYPNARKYFLINASKQANSAYHVGVTYEMEENYTEARKWYQKALSMGMNESEERLKEIRNKKDKIKYKYTEGDKIREDESSKIQGTESHY